MLHPYKSFNEIRITLISNYPLGEHLGPNRDSSTIQTQSSPVAALTKIKN